MAINGDTQLKIDSIYSERVDLQNRTNPFVEVTFLFNQQGELPIFASLTTTASGTTWMGPSLSMISTGRRGMSMGRRLG